MDKNPLLKYMMKAKKEDVVHSSGYAMVQNQGFGAASTSSFEERRKLEENRTRIKGYRDSQLASGAVNMRPKAQVYTPPEPNMGVSSFSSSSSSRPAPTPPRNPGISR